MSTMLLMCDLIPVLAVLDSSFIEIILVLLSVVMSARVRERLTYAVMFFVGLH